MKPGLGSLRTRVVRLEGGGTSSTPDVEEDASRFDWFGGVCPCGRPIGECREHPRARDSQRPQLTGWRTWLLLAGRGFGKMVDVDTPIPTPSGWSVMGSLRVGDRVFDESGRVCRVTFVSLPEVPDRAYRLKFSDGSSVDACADHQWVTWDHAERGAFLRSPYEDVSRFPAEWPAWRLRQRHGGNDHGREIVEEALRMHASGVSMREVARRLGVSRGSLVRHLRAGRFVEREAAVQSNSIGPRIRTTEEIARTLYYIPHGVFSHCIPNCGPLILPEASLPINPYVLGVWLGIGEWAEASLTLRHADAELFELLRAEGCAVLDRESSRVGLSGRYELGGVGRISNPSTGRKRVGGSLAAELVRAGLVYNKHIPDAYLRASTTQRLALLQGLMDSAGVTKKAPILSFSTFDRELADTVYELVVSLGMRARRESCPDEADEGSSGLPYRVAFPPTMAVFRLPRKLARVGLDVGAPFAWHHRMIVGADVIKPRWMRCIAVDSPHRMYLCGPQMVPTHNTRTGAEWVRHLAESGEARRIALVAPTSTDARDVMIEGESGILSISPSWARPKYEPSKRRLTWPNGAIATAYSADEPERLRGPQHELAWVDELAAWRYPQAWDNLMFGLRLGDNPRVCVTTTPKPVRLVKTLLAEPTTAIVRGSTHENRSNLAPSFFEKILATYEGTRLGRQEIYAEILEISEGAWFTRFDPAKHVTESAEYDHRFRVHLAIDCGVSRHVGAVFFQVREIGPQKHRVTVFGDFHVEGLFSEASARAIRAKAEELPCQGRLDVVRVDPASSARTGVGPAAYGEFERVFGSRIMSRWPQHLVLDGLDQLEILLDSDCLLMHPRCAHLKGAFQNYARAHRGGQWLDQPADPQHPYEDVMDALRGGVRDQFPGGRIEQPRLRTVHL